MQRNWLRYLHIAAKSWTAWNNVKHHTSYIIHLLSHHTSSIKHQTSSDCTGGRIGDAVRYCQLEPISLYISWCLAKRLSSFEDKRSEICLIIRSLQWIKIAGRAAWQVKGCDLGWFKTRYIHRNTGLLEEGHKEILQSWCYQDYVVPSYIR